MTAHGNWWGIPCKTSPSSPSARRRCAASRSCSIAAACPASWGYEIFGTSAYGYVVWRAVLEAGKEFGLRQLGVKSAQLNHLQAFFPTIFVDYLPAFIPGADALHRFPSDYGWEGLIDKTRDFPGKAAMLAEIENPTGRTVTLEWNSDDVVSVYASLFDRDNESFEQIPLPVNVSGYSSGTAMTLPVFGADNQFIGLTTLGGYSAQFKTFISLAQLDIAHVSEGTEVFVLYGSEGRRQQMMRARVVQDALQADLLQGVANAGGREQ